MAGPGGSALLGAWPTPDAAMHQGVNTSPGPAGARPNISLAAAMWPTPTTENDQGAESERNRRTPSLSSAALWMTPSVSNSQGNEYTRDRGQEGQERLTLTGQAAQWPSPNVQDAEAAGGQGAIDRGTRGETLHTMTAQWPTPASRDFRTPNSQESQESRTIHGGEQLPNFVEHHFSHPALSTHDGPGSSENTQASRRRLNPAFGCWLMGWPWWYTSPGLTSCAKSAMESWRHRLALHLQSYCGERG